MFIGGRVVGLLLAWPMAVACGSAPAVPAASVAPSEKAAVAAAEVWLQTIDAGRYGESWDAAASYFRNAVTRQVWEQSLNGVRAPLGALVSRKVKSTEPATRLPGAPDGQYVVIQFDASFANKTRAVETVTPMLDTDGTWRVSGYYIR